MKPQFTRKAAAVLIILLLTGACSRQQAAAGPEGPSPDAIRKERLIYKQSGRGGSEAMVVVDYLPGEQPGQMIVRHETLRDDEALPEIGSDLSSEIRVNLESGSMTDETLNVDENELPPEYEGFAGCTIRRDGDSAVDYSIRLKEGPQKRELTQRFELKNPYPIFTVNSLVLAGVRLFSPESFPQIYLFLQGGSPIPVEGTMSAAEDTLLMDGKDISAVKLEFRITDPLSNKLLSRFLGDTAVWVEKAPDRRLLRMDFMGQTTVLDQIITIRD